MVSAGHGRLLRWCPSARRRRGIPVHLPIVLAGRRRLSGCFSGPLSRRRSWFEAHLRAASNRAIALQRDDFVLWLDSQALVSQSLKVFPCQPGASGPVPEGPRLCGPVSRVSWATLARARVSWATRARARGDRRHAGGCPIPAILEFLCHVVFWSSLVPSLVPPPTVAATN